MSKTNDKFEKKRLRSSNITVIISISLVLFLLGIFGLIVINAQSYAEHLKRELKIEAYFKDVEDPKLKDKELDLQKSYIDSLKVKYSFVEATKYISKEEAGKIAKKDLGTDGSDFFEESIFPASVQITLNPNTIQSVEQIDSINKVLAKNTIIDEVKSDKEAMVTIYQSINKITFWLMIFAVIFLVIVVILINNSIRLKIYAKRFSIKTMQLVGARRRFIMKPFLIEGAILGFFAATIAIIGLSALWYTLATKVGLLLWNPNYTALILILIAIGVIIAIFSTLFAAWRYLRLKTDQLY
ncbi:cell division transport system permease protein [Chishuiella changwenlii]|jgi:cell division transport system permease protein|uniref:Cell division protein FtsX n=1 Tax=Chishuiella changwenlii TaxID=1434701 RepID=A0A1M7BQC6_9FLAO|nr:permease-like cell division protein FtsX [Chishuiella changwenlii]GGF03112.1 cell division protein FtsX [Chishuiella changwenlii]SHL56759.1 cell division transport system permease protein [Chishuiella changwenlii]